MSGLLHNLCKLLEGKGADWQVLSEENGNEKRQQRSLFRGNCVKCHEIGRRKAHTRFQTFLKINLFSIFVELLVELAQLMQTSVKMSNKSDDIQWIQ